MTPEQIIIWQDIVESCQSRELRSINVGTNQRRAAIIAVNDELEAQKPRQPWKVGNQLINAVEAKELSEYFQRRHMMVETGFDSYDPGDEIIRRVLAQYVAVNGEPK